MFNYMYINFAATDNNYTCALASEESVQAGWRYSVLSLSLVLIATGKFAGSGCLLACLKLFPLQHLPTASVA